MSAILLGDLDPSGCPQLKLNLCGVKHDLPGLEFSGIIDTGFSGFIQLPFTVACSLQLPLEGTTTVSLADNSPLVMLTALANATLAERTELGTVYISTTSETLLLGMDFLSRFDRALVVSKKFGVAVHDEIAIQQGLEAGE